MAIRKFAGAMVSMIHYLSGRAKKYHEPVNPKGWFGMLSDHLWWILREREFNHHYFSQRLNEKGSRISEYIGRRSLNILRRRSMELVFHGPEGLNFRGCELLVKDKFYCSAILKAAGYPVPDTLFLIADGVVHPLSELRTIEEMSGGEYFIKNTIMESGSGVFSFSVRDGNWGFYGGGTVSDGIMEMTKKGRWIIQRKLLSHPAIRAINNTALNTTRIFTVKSGSGAEYAGGYQAFATGSSVTDSWQYGSLYVSIDPSRNKLGKYGITSQSDPRRGLMYEHPDSGVVFDMYEIPFLEESVRLCCRAHSLFEGALVIGWDIAITSGGPLILEANENPGVNVLQCFTGGIRKRIKVSYGDLKRSYHARG